MLVQHLVPDRIGWIAVFASCLTDLYQIIMGTGEKKSKIMKGAVDSEII